MLQHEWMSIQAEYTAETLFRRAYLRGLLGRTLALLFRHERRLTTIIAQGLQIEEQPGAAVQHVELAQIVGSTRTSSGFDSTFNPLSAQGEGRWKQIAAALVAGQTLPPVELVQIGQRYIVRDGHYRISVARALGRSAIEAVISGRGVVDAAEGTQAGALRKNRPSAGQSLQAHL